MPKKHTRQEDETLPDAEWDRFTRHLARGLTPPARLTRKVMRQVYASLPAGRQRRAAPLVLRLKAMRWALTGTAVIVLIALGLARRQLVRPTAGRPVTLTLVMPEARTVAVVGDFNAWNPRNSALADPEKDGVWTVTLQLDPGRYQYGFLVDGARWETDPNAKWYANDGFGGRNAIIRL